MYAVRYLSYHISIIVLLLWLIAINIILFSVGITKRYRPTTKYQVGLQSKEEFKNCIRQKNKVTTEKQSIDSIAVIALTTNCWTSKVMESYIISETAHGITKIGK